jgi:hypothetical protein
MFENWVTRRIFGRNRDRVTEGYRKMQEEELHNLSLHQIFIPVTKLKMRRESRMNGSDEK